MIITNPFISFTYSFALTQHQCMEVAMHVPNGLKNLEDLHSAPTWAILKNVPPQLYSLQGISVIASGIGLPLHTEKSRLDPVNIGATKVKVVIKLDVPLPASVVVQDVQGNSVRVAVEYPRPPPKCLNCGRYGHLLSRCPKPLMKKLPFSKDIPSGSKLVTHPTISLAESAGGSSAMESEPQVNPPKPKRRRSRSKKRSTSTPPLVYSRLVKGKDKVSPEGDLSAPSSRAEWVVKHSSCPPKEESVVSVVSIPPVPIQVVSPSKIQSSSPPVLTPLAPSQVMLDKEIL
ncbi:hypothetical protein CARUB_v10024684mg, partial [Capsella rubella]